MTALGNVPCNGCRACCLHNMIPLMPERGDLIWTYKHEVVATAAGPKAVLQCGETGECIYLARDGCTMHDRAPAICRARWAPSLMATMVPKAPLDPMKCKDSRASIPLLITVRLQILVLAGPTRLPSSYT